MSAALAVRPLRWPTKDPSDVLDFSRDWSAYMPVPVGDDTPDEITFAEWSATPTGLDLTDKLETTTATVIWIGGGEAATDYVVTCRVETAAGREIERSVLLRVDEL